MKRLVKLLNNLWRTSPGHPLLKSWRYLSMGSAPSSIVSAADSRLSTRSPLGWIGCGVSLSSCVFSSSPFVLQLTFGSILSLGFRMGCHCILWCCVFCCCACVQNSIIANFYTKKTTASMAPWNWWCRSCANSLIGRIVIRCKAQNSHAGSHLMLLTIYAINHGIINKATCSSNSLTPSLYLPSSANISGFGRRALSHRHQRWSESVVFCHKGRSCLFSSWC